MRLHAGGGHVEVALLENLQRQQAAGKEHSIEREQREAQRFDGGAGWRADEVEPAHHAPQRCISVCGTAS
jgi:hypothetical protein